MKQYFRMGDEDTKNVFELASQLLNRYRFRITGTDNALKAGEAIKDLFSKNCHKSMLEPFTVYPGQLWNIGKILTASYFISLIAFFFDRIGTFVSLSVIAAGLLYAMIHFIGYGSMFDKLFKKANAQNAVGIIEPPGTVKQQVILIGHHDSPYVFRYLLHHQSFYGIRIMVSICGYLVGAMISLFRFLFFLRNGYAFHSFLLTFMILIGWLAVLPLFFFITREPSPGAGDNLIGSVMTIGISRLFGGKGNQTRLNLKNTRLIFLSTDAEEIGQRGAKSFLQRHMTEIEDTPTYAINIDSIYNYDDLTLLARDRNGLVRLSKSQNRRCMEIAEQLGIDIQLKSIPFGGGGTDGSWFAVNHSQAISIIGMPMNFRKKVVYYHTPYDTIDKIEPKAVQAVMELIVNYILEIDSR